MTHCPVCDSYVDDNVPTASLEQGGETYYFESAKCKERFEEDPSQYA